MLIKQTYYILLTLGCVIFIASCGKKAPFFEENQSIPDKTWGVNDTVTFNFSINDTNQLYDFYFNLRN